MFSAEGNQGWSEEDRLNCQAVKSINEIQPFRGMTQYVAHFIPDIASRTEPLCRLTKKEVSWEWTQRELEALSNINEALTGMQVTAYFSPAEQTDRSSCRHQPSQCGCNPNTRGQDHPLCQLSADRCGAEVLTDRPWATRKGHLSSDPTGSTVFSKLDLSSAYYQLELDEASRQVTALTTRAGIWHRKHAQPSTSVPLALQLKLWPNKSTYS